MTNKGPVYLHQLPPWIIELISHRKKAETIPELRTNINKFLNTVDLSKISFKTIIETLEEQRKLINHNLEETIKAISSQIGS